MAKNDRTVVDDELKETLCRAIDDWFSAREGTERVLRPMR